MNQEIVLVTLDLLEYYLIFQIIKYCDTLYEKEDIVLIGKITYKIERSNQN